MFTGPQRWRLHRGAGASAPVGSAARGVSPPLATRRALQLLAAALCLLCGAVARAETTQAAPAAEPPGAEAEATAAGPRELEPAIELGTRRAAVQLLIGPPLADWTKAAADGGESAERWLWPVADGRLLRGMGASKLQRPSRAKGRAKARRGRRHVHAGLDIGAPEGAPILAAQSGLVVYSGNGVRGYGNLIVVVHADGSAALYAHCRASSVKPGQWVGRGEALGEVGHTGIARGPHLHFEYRVQGKPRDPRARFEARP